MTPERFIDVCQCEPLEQAVLFAVLVDSHVVSTVRRVRRLLEANGVKVPARDVRMAIKQLLERGALMPAGVVEGHTNFEGWRFYLRAYRVRYEGE